jgi:hypothetical protein
LSLAGEPQIDDIFVISTGLLIGRRSVRQTCSCRCGASRLSVTGEPIGRLFCHCPICQAFNKQSYADVTVFPAQSIALASNNAVTFRQYRPPPALDRGACSACGGAVVEFMAFGPLKVLAFVPWQNFERPTELPEPSLHIFYDRRVADATDVLPKASGYWASQASVFRMLLVGWFRTKRAA